MRVNKYIENYSKWSFPLIDMEKFGPNYGKSSIGDVGSVFGNIGGRKSRRVSILQNVIHDEENDIFYTKDEIDDLLERYRMYCLKGNIKPILNDDSYLDGETLTYIKKLLDDNEK